MVRKSMFIFMISAVGLSALFAASFINRSEVSIRGGRVFLIGVLGWLGVSTAAALLTFWLPESQGGGAIFLRGWVRSDFLAVLGATGLYWLIFGLDRFADRRWVFGHVLFYFAGFFTAQLAGHYAGHFGFLSGYELFYRPLIALSLGAVSVVCWAYGSLCRPHRAVWFFLLPGAVSLIPGTATFLYQINHGIWALVLLFLFLGASLFLFIWYGRRRVGVFSK